MNDALRFLCARLHSEREKAGRGFETVLLDHIEVLLSGGESLAPVPVNAPERQVALRSLRRHIRRSLGLLPFPRRGKLGARTVGRLRRDGYVIEKVVFHPHPGLAVPAHLYMPELILPPLPGVLYASGHFVEDGILHPESQACCIALAKLGFAVLAYEAMGQGERGPAWEEFRRVWLPELQRSRRLVPFRESRPDPVVQRKWMAWAWHCVQGEHALVAPMLVGWSQLGWMVWESVRALDYLCSRPEVDASRLGIVGVSGGGQNAYYTAALDPRPQAVVSVCYPANLSQQIRMARGNNWWGGGDLCDQVPQHLTYAEYADVGALILPRPLLWVAARDDDGFPIDAARSEFRRLAALYGAVAPDRLHWTDVPGPHGLSQPMREAAYGWLVRWLQQRGDGNPSPEPELSLEPPDSSDLRCLGPDDIRSSRPALMRLSVQRAARYRKARQIRPMTPAQCVRRVQQVLGTPASGVLQVEHTALATSAGIQGRLLRLGTGTRVRLFATELRSAGSPDRQLCLLLPGDGWDKVWDEGWVDTLLGRGCALAILDVRGCGPGSLRTARPANRLRALEEILLAQDQHGEAFVTDFEVSSAYWMLGRTLLGERVGDVRGFLDWFAGQCSDLASVSCIGMGSGGVVALLAAALDQRLQTVATCGSPASFEAMLVEEPALPPSSFLFDVLRQFDLPDVLMAIAPRRVTLANPCDGHGKRLSSDEAAELEERVRQSGNDVQAWVAAPADAIQAVCDRTCSLEVP